ncbi:DUF6911 family protein [Xanthomonas translucens]|nr:hypothetical protein [Xanthomonas translucens]MCT8271754.1 hypothetical protein [Xanthomonas translucens pv. undulosa]
MGDSKKPVFELRSLDKSISPLVKVIENPWWDEIGDAIKRCYENDGFVKLEIILPKSGYINKISMNSSSGMFRVVAITNDEDAKRQLLEWWDPNLTEYRGLVKFGEDNWDSRTISKDLVAAQNIFLEFYETGDLGLDSLNNMRSQWERKQN